MAFSQTDLDNIDAALVRFAVDGFASVTVGGQTTAIKSLDELIRLRKMIADQVASSSPNSGLRIRQLVPGGCG